MNKKQKEKKIPSNLNYIRIIDCDDDVESILLGIKCNFSVYWYYLIVRMKWLSKKIQEINEKKKTNRKEYVNE